MWFLFKCFHEDVVLLGDRGIEEEGRVSEQEKVTDRDCEGASFRGAGSGAHISSPASWSH